MARMRLARLAVHTRTREPLALFVEVLDEGDGPVATDRALVMGVRREQADVLAAGPQPDRDDDRRLTQDLLADLAVALGRRLARAEVVDLVDGRFHARIVLDDGTALAARPGDALAVAVREGLPVLVAEGVLDRAGQSLSALAPPSEPWPAPEDEQVRDLRRALDGATVEDFRRESGPGEDRDGSAT